jgi:sirohydrochlorin cobaltochelatase
MPDAYLFVTHGSRDPRPQKAAEDLAWRVAARQSGLLVATAALELQPLPLHQQICQFSDRAFDLGILSIQVVPLFLLLGVHVMEDIPAEVELARQQLDGDRSIDLRSHLGSHPQFVQLLASAIASSPMTNWTQTTAWILLAHGSRRPGGNQPVEAIAAQLARNNCCTVNVAYWSVAPSLDVQIQTLADAGYLHIGIVPYFLFAGGITEAIGQSIAQLRLQFPQLKLYLADPIGVSDALVEICLDLSKSSSG